MTLPAFSSGSPAEALPFNHEAEFSVLGSAMYDPDTLVDMVGLAPSDFYEPVAGRVFEAVQHLHSRGRRPDPVTVAAELGPDPALAEFGGAAWLAELVERCQPHTAASHSAVVVEMSRRRQLHALGRTIQALVTGEAETDDGEADGIVAVAQQALAAIANAGEPTGNLIGAREAADAVFDELEEEAAGRAPSGLLTGLRCVDMRLRGLRGGRLIFIGGRPGMGKSALARGIAYAAARRNASHAFLFYSLEMSRREITERALSEASHLSRDGDGIAYEDFSALRPDERAYLRRLRDDLPANLSIDDRSRLSVQDVRRGIFAAKRRGQVGAVFIDYLQLMQRPAAAGRRGDEIIGEMTAELKRIARETGVCLVVLSQLSRAVESREDKRPELSDLRESGSIEQDADAVLFPYREHFYLSRNEPEPGTQAHRDWQDECAVLFRRLDVIARKVRQGAPGTDRQEFWIEYDHTRDVAPEAREGGWRS